MNKNLILAEILNKAQEIKKLYEQVEKLNKDSYISLDVWGDNHSTFTVSTRADNKVDSIHTLSLLSSGDILENTILCNKKKISKDPKFYDNIEDFIESEDK